MKKSIQPRRLVRAGILVAFVLAIIVIFSQQPQNYASIIYPPIPDSHFQYISEAVDFCQLPKNKRGFIAAVAMAESTFNAKAQSGAGAVGVMQLLRGTGFGIANKYQIGGLNAQTFTEPSISYKMGTCYIHYLMGEVVGNYEPSNWDNEQYLRAIMVGYNAGPAQGRAYLAGRYNAAGPVGYAFKIMRASPVYTLDFVRYDQQVASGENPFNVEVRDFIWRFILGSNDET